MTCRIDDRDLEALDALIEAGIRNTRSDAASWLIYAGIEAHQPLLQRVRATVAEIRQLRTDAQVMAQQLAEPASLPDETTHVYAPACWASRITCWLNTKRPCPTRCTPATARISSTPCASCDSSHSTTTT